MTPTSSRRSKKLLLYRSDPLGRAIRLRVIDGCEQVLALVQFNVAPEATGDVQAEQISMSGEDAGGP